jgi:hypothetical protein
MREREIDFIVLKMTLTNCKVIYNFTFKDNEVIITLILLLIVSIFFIT